MVVQVQAEVQQLRRVGAYHHLTLLAPGAATHARPGQFAAVAVGGAQSAMLLRRTFSLYRASETGPFGATVEVVFAVAGAGTRWLAERRAGDRVDVVAPLGRPFSLPRDPVVTTLVGGGYGVAPLFALGEALRARGCRVHVVMGAASRDRLFGALEAKRMADSVAFTTEDGTAGERGRVTDVLPAVLARTDSSVVYACGPMAMLAAVAAVANDRGLASQVAVEESMACGIGVCMTCVLPVRDSHGVTRMLRSCVEGPVFGGDRVRFDAVGTVPADTLGAPAPVPAPAPGQASAEVAS